MKAPRTTTKRVSKSKSKGFVSFNGKLTTANKNWLAKQAKTGNSTQQAILNDIITQVRRSK